MSARVLLIAVDPGASSGVAVYAEGRLVHVERVQSHAVDPWPKIGAIRRAGRALDLPATAGGKLVGSPRAYFATEDQYLGHGNAQSMAELARNAACWETCAAIMGYTVRPRENPKVWQAAYGLHGRGKNHAWRAERIREIVAAQCNGLAALAEQEDVQAAILLGAVAAMRLHGWSGILNEGQPPYEWVRHWRTKYAPKPRRGQRPPERRATGNERDPDRV